MDFMIVTLYQKALQQGFSVEFHQVVPNKRQIEDNGHFDPQNAPKVNMIASLVFVLQSGLLYITRGGGVHLVFEESSRFR